MLTNYLSVIEEAIIQEFRQYIHPNCHRKRPRCPPLRASPLSPSSSTTHSSPLLTPLHDKYHVSYITHSIV
ncbi:unnamed protein product [Absidia cylindrospora]